jgi:hypothetical protein
MSLFEQKYPNNIRTIVGLLNVPFQDDVILECNTLLGAVGIQLQIIPANFWSTQYKLYVVDKSNNASLNNITITAPVGFLINGASSVVINANGGSYVIRVASNTDYVGQYSSNNALASLPIENTVFVAKNGDDTTGLPERLDKPFLTIAGARASAIAFFVGAKLPSLGNRILIKVFSGNYQETIILDNCIDYDLGNSTFNSKSPNLITDNGVEVNSIVLGSANLGTVANQGVVIGINIANIKSSVVVNINNIDIQSTTVDSVTGVYCEGNLTLNFNNIYVAGTLVTDIAGVRGIICANAGKIYVKATGNVSIFSLSGGNGVACSGTDSEIHYEGWDIIVAGATQNGRAFFGVNSSGGGKMWIRCNNIDYTLGANSLILYSSAVACGVGVGSQMYLKCNEINVVCDVLSPFISCCQLGRSNGSALTTNAVMVVECYQATISGERADTQAISSQNNDASCVATFKGKYRVIAGAFANCNAVNILEDGTSGNGLLIFDNATLIGNGVGFSVSSILPHNVNIYGGCQSNKVVDATITEVVNTITVNIAVV